MKFNVKKTVIVLIVIILASFAIAAATLYFTGGVSTVSVKSSQIKTSKSYPVDGIEKLVIKTSSAKVNIIPVLDKKIGIDFYGTFTTNLDEIKPEMRTSLENGVLTVEISYGRAINIGLINFEQLYLDIYMPDNYLGQISADTISGDLVIRRFDLSQFDFKSVSGNLRAEAVNAGSVNIETASGNMDLTDIKGQINANNISGELKAKLNSLQGNINIKTVSGKIDIELPRESEFEFVFESLSGNIKNEFPADIKFVDNRRIEGNVGKGINMISLNTSSGNISIEKGE
ncbi:MAG: DUF4097 family beta strand repeat protein [Actinobacteria bacterium]|nr:DUF4097 family beta strand repeat protein [Actinomycetota bacterium]